MDGDEVGLGKQFVHLDIGDAQLFFDAGDVEDIKGDDGHADGLGHDAQMLADAAEADDAEGLALQFNALAVCLLFPLALAHGVARDGKIACAGEHMAHGQLCDGLGGSLRGVLDSDAVGLGILHVDVVNADTAADDELQLAALGLVDVVRADLGLGANDDCVKLTQGRAQFFRSIELLDDLVACLTQLRHCGLVHSISYENTHDKISLYLFCETRRDRICRAL